MEGDLWATARFIDNLKIPYIAPSLGGVESLIEMPAVQSYWSFGPEGRAQIGIKENLVSVCMCVCVLLRPLGRLTHRSCSLSARCNMFWLLSSRSRSAR